VGLIGYKTLSPVGASHDEATLSNGPGMLGCPFRASSFWGTVFPWRCHGLKVNCPCGASDLAKIRAGFLKNPERLIDGIPVANHPENFELW
jgi:hypothetical protein